MAYKIQRYGWKPSLPDVRNVPADTTDMPILDEVDPREQMQPCYDQGQLGSCTANAYAGAVEYNAILNGHKIGTPSRLAIYYGERLREGTAGEDSGAFGHDAFKDGRKYGVGPEALWPYDIRKFAEEPSSEYLTARASYKVGTYRHPPQQLAALKRVLSNNQTIAFGFTVYSSFESEEVAKTGKVPMPSSREEVLGGHETLIVGYLQAEEEYALVRNSWGTEWGLGGYFLLPWMYILNPNLVSDLRTIYRPQQS
jgi:C1A family cysteine protease